MLPKLKKSWIEALRSGKYQQGPGRLRACHGEAFCCLGVLHDIKSGGKWDKSLGVYYLSGTKHCSILPGNVYGLPDCLQGKLVGMNDQGTPFPEIADWIETNVPEDNHGPENWK